jgi:hypothetical protein
LMGKMRKFDIFLAVCVAQVGTARVGRAGCSFTHEDWLWGREGNIDGMGQRIRAGREVGRTGLEVRHWADAAAWAGPPRRGG